MPYCFRKVSDHVTHDDVTTKLCLTDVSSLDEDSAFIKTDGNLQSNEQLLSRADISENNDSKKNNASDSDVISNNVISDNEMHRVSITIKLCCDCDSRHLQDGCPLRNPEKIICDSVCLNDWNRSRSPDLQLRDEEEDSFESRSDFACLSLPNCLELKEIDPDHGLSVVAKQALPASTQFGPLIGQPIKEMEIPDDFSMKDIWEVSLTFYYCRELVYQYYFKISYYNN